MATVQQILLRPDTHANRPDPHDVNPNLRALGSALFPCTTHHAVEQYDYASDSWSNWDGSVPAGGTSGQVLAKASGTDYDTGWVDASSGSSELDYTEITAPVNVTATSEATANTIVTAGAVSFDGSTAVLIEFSAPLVRPDGASNRGLSFWLFEDGSSIGRLAYIVGVTSTYQYVPVRLARRMTPSAASHTYSIRCTVTAGTGLVGAGAGGSGSDMPAFIRISQDT